ncbi:hypothetical protein Tco_1186748 [Tanacetum coccineum]
MAVRVHPVMSPVLLARVTEAMTLSDLAFCERYRSPYVTSSSPPALPLWKSYQGTSELILDTEIENVESKAEGASSGSEESEDEGPDSDGEEAAPEGQQQAVQVADTSVKVEVNE